MKKTTLLLLALFASLTPLLGVVGLTQGAFDVKLKKGTSMVSVDIDNTDINSFLMVGINTGDVDIIPQNGWSIENNSSRFTLDLSNYITASDRFNPLPSEINTIVGNYQGDDYEFSAIKWQTGNGNGSERFRVINVTQIPEPSFTVACFMIFALSYVLYKR